MIAEFANYSQIEKNAVNARCEQLTSSYRQLGTKINTSCDKFFRCSFSDCFNIVLQTFVYVLNTAWEPFGEQIEQVEIIV